MEVAAAMAEEATMEAEVAMEVAVVTVAVKKNSL